jgi:hypothetical protein
MARTWRQLETKVTFLSKDHELVTRDPLVISPQINTLTFYVIISLIFINVRQNLSGKKNQAMRLLPNN